MVHNNMTEQELINQILKGDVKLFEDLIVKYQKIVLAIAIRFVNNENDREEICQEIFVKIYQSLSGFNFDSKLSTWIGKIAYNHCINYIKKNSKNRFMDSIDSIDNSEWTQNIDSENDFYETLEQKEINFLIHKYIERLPNLYRTIINLFHVQELSYKEISEILDLPEGTVKSYLFRSRKMLKEKLLSSYKEEEFV